MDWVGACTPDNISKKNDISMDHDISDNNIITEIHEWQAQAKPEEQRKSAKDIAAERREKNIDKFKAYQDRAYKKLKDRKVSLVYDLYASVSI